MFEFQGVRFQRESAESRQPAGLARFEQYKGLIRKDIPLVPEVALREALVNAVAHHDYTMTDLSNRNGGVVEKPENRDGPLEMENVTSEQRIIPVAQRLHY